MQNIIACVTDGAPAMIGKYKRFLVYLKEHVPGIFTIHCVIHRQDLVSKILSPNLQDSLNYVIKLLIKLRLIH